MSNSKRVRVHTNTNNCSVVRLEADEIKASLFLDIFEMDRDLEPFEARAMAARLETLAGELCRAAHAVENQRIEFHGGVVPENELVLEPTEVGPVQALTTPQVGEFVDVLDRDGQWHKRLQVQSSYPRPEAPGPCASDDDDGRFVTLRRLDMWSGKPAIRLIQTPDQPEGLPWRQSESRFEGEGFEGPTGPCTFECMEAPYGKLPQPRDPMKAIPRYSVENGDGALITEAMPLAAAKLKAQQLANREGQTFLRVAGELLEFRRGYAQPSVRRSTVNTTHGSANGRAELPAVRTNNAQSLLASMQQRQTVQAFSEPTAPKGGK